MELKKPFCLMPWIHFHVGDNGVAKACCVANIKYGNINSNSLEEIWNGTQINKLRVKFANGVLDKRCAVCINSENSGATSIRQETLKKYPNIHIQKNSEPIYFDIRFSNVCNLKCRTCWHGASSSWFEDAKNLGTNKGKKAVIKNIEDFNLFISKVGPYLLKAKEIYLAGGEPLVTEEHYLLLDWLIKNGATQMKLRYNTNFTVLKYKGKSVLDLWKHFTHVEILASLDAKGDLASYVRSNSNWNEILTNFSSVQQLAYVSIQIAPTISNLNVEFLPDLITECINNNLITEQDIYINILDRPVHYNIQALPPEKKQIITQKLMNFGKAKSLTLKTQLQEIVTYMNAKDQCNHWPKYVSENQLLNQLRNESHPIKTRII
ncbi:MAG: twitch domain-containing radical SAM protein [Salibacteraceae bacterium]